MKIIEKEANDLNLALCGRKKKGIFEFLSYPIQLRVSAYTEAGSHRGIAVLGEGEVRSRTHTRPGRPGPGAAAETPPRGHGPPDAALTPVSERSTNPSLERVHTAVLRRRLLSRTALQCLLATSLVPSLVFPS